MGIKGQPDLQSQLISVWPDCLLTSGEMGKRVREFDWSKTSLGPIESWSKSLQTVVRMVLSSSFPMVVLWGADYVEIYNDKFISHTGSRHPNILGMPAAQNWPEVWEIHTKPHFDEVRRTSKAIILEDQPATLQRFGYQEEVYATAGYSTLYGDNTEIEGYLLTVVEVIDKIHSGRRLQTLWHLEEQTASTQAPEEICRRAADVLKENRNDIPFALIYILDEVGHKAHLAGISGIEANQPASPAIIRLSDIKNSADWPLNTVMSDGPQHIQDLERRFGMLPGGPWPESSREAFVLPLVSQARERTIGVMVLGISPRIKFEDKYREFFMLVATQVETALGNAWAYEQERKRAEVFAELDRAKTTFFIVISKIK